MGSSGFPLSGESDGEVFMGALAWYPRTEPLESGPQLPSVRLPSPNVQPKMSGLAKTDSSCHKRVGVSLFGGPFLVVFEGNPQEHLPLFVWGTTYKPTLKMLRCLAGPWRQNELTMHAARPSLLNP